MQPPHRREVRRNSAASSRFPLLLRLQARRRLSHSGGTPVVLHCDFCRPMFQMGHERVSALPSGADAGPLARHLVAWHSAFSGRIRRAKLRRWDLLVAVVLIFAVAYAAIALEHPIGISKSASALLGAGLLWTVYALSTGDHTRVEHELRETLGVTAGIIFFLMGAMTIVEVIDAHDGFEIVTSRVRTTSLTGLLWVVAWITFFLSAI